MTARENGSEQEPVIRDNRKIDPETGTARTGKPGAAASDGAAPAAADASADTVADTAEAPAEAVTGTGADLLAERTADLQRLHAEYANYRKRVDRDRSVVKDQAVSGVLTELLPVLDDIGRARDHGELTGGFAKVSESLEAILGKLGLVKYGAKGDPFDPNVHEALLHSYSADVSEPTCVEILQPGYRMGDQILRPARVAVAEPDESVAAEPSDSAESGESDEN
ncbi:nucleotide exchange factor GrpE [Microtetraspora sp. AC03309]|uniref:nucleotide exchange factor GrpE n=1 Tax=Microtetraspora sp. AC03309 TaxID=2779376 RepID=UPI001E34BBEE|nr:nucleotide exchange factor GrpE [Microtetraspora sp. AC03309]MCC5576620.1 nucleotide exchange factor GrpE [Microtetraspora sp. AC03309]